MKSNKLVSSLLVAGVVLSVGTATLVGGSDAQAATVISQTSTESIISFTKADLDAATGVKLTTTNASSVLAELKKSDAWKSLGYSSSEASRIASRFSLSQQQALGILKDLAKNSNLSLKVVVINKLFNKSVNIGTVGTATPPVNPNENNGGGSTGGGSTVKPDEKPSTGGGSTGGGSSQVAAAIKEIDVKVEYKKKDIEFEYEVKSNGTIKAKFENEFTGVKLEGKAAQQKVEAIMAGLDVKGSSQSQIKTHILNKLGADSNFKKFEFEVKFTDKSEVDFKLK